MSDARASRSSHIVAAASLFLSWGWAPPGHAAESVYATETATTLPSSNTGWDYITLDQATGRLFIARRIDGLTVWDTKSRQVVATVENSTGANGVVLVPEFGPGRPMMGELADAGHPASAIVPRLCRATRSDEGRQTKDR